ncbi:MAG TPA: phosphohistidine phosphatase SixA [Thermoanaerobaculia bacterium]|nr:phosphohistidine phosphatase SixA [Thermoanaerobaculia bacterium]
MNAERFLILLRHAVAEEASADVSDEDRSLTSEGHARMKQIARGLEVALPRVDALYSSPLVRAQQTAMWVSKAYRARLEINTTEALAPAASVEEFRKLIDAIDEKRAIVVGHEPNLTEILRSLIGIDASRVVELQKGGCYGVRINADGTAVLEWLLPPRILLKLGEE